MYRSGRKCPSMLRGGRKAVKAEKSVALRGNLFVVCGHSVVSGQVVRSETPAESEHRHVPSPIHVVGGVARRPRPPRSPWSRVVPLGRSGAADAPQPQVVPAPGFLGGRRPGGRGRLRGGDQHGFGGNRVRGHGLLVPAGQPQHRPGAGRLRLRRVRRRFGGAVEPHRRGEPAVEVHRLG